jgi:hypothetical protein
MGNKNQREYWEHLVPFLQKIIYLRLMTEIYCNDDTTPFAW